MQKNILKRTPVLLLAGAVMLASFTSCAGKKTVVKNASSLAASGLAAVSGAASQVSQSSAASAISIGQNVGGGGTAGGENAKTGKSYSVPAYSTKSYFGSGANKKETKIALNNRNIVAPSIPSSAAAASIIKRTQIEGVDGSFADAKINESVRDMGGKTFVLGTFWSDQYANDKNATADAQRCNKALRAIEQDYNCKIKVQGMGDAQAELKKIVSSRSSGKMYVNVMDSLACQNFLAISGNSADLLKVNSVGVKNNQWNKALTLISSFKNQVLGVGVRYDRLEQDLLFFNKRLASTYNLGNFYDMVDKNQWTDDRFLQVSQAFKKYVGSKYTVTESMYPTHVLNFVYTNWSSPFAITSNKYIFNGADSTVLNILDYLQDYVKAGYLDTFYNKNDMKPGGTFEVCSDDYTHALSAFEKGKSLFFLGSNGDAVLPDIYKHSADDFGVLPLPKGPSADDYSTVITNARYFSLIQGDPDIENDGAILTAIANRTNIPTSGIVAHNTSLVRDKESLDMLTQNYLHKQIINVELSNAGNLADIYYGAAVPCVINRQSTPKQAMDSISRMAQTTINTAYGQK